MPTDESLTVKLYFQLRSDLQHDVENQSKTKSWAIALAGAGLYAFLSVLVMSPPTKGALIGDPHYACAAILAVVGIVNFLFVLTSWEQGRGIVRSGAFMYVLEEEMQYLSGWEHYVFMRRAKGSFGLLFTDVTVYIQVAVSLLSVLLFPRYGKYGLIAMLVMCCLGAASILLRLNTKSYRRKALNEVTAFFKQASQK